MAFSPLDYFGCGLQLARRARGWAPWQLAEKAFGHVQQADVDRIIELERGEGWPSQSERLAFQRVLGDFLPVEKPLFRHRGGIFE
jgi:ribosome-binding protein aMBF1 (putative translation factor)